MSDSVWTRHRKLHEAEGDELTTLRHIFKGLATELDNDDWRAAATSAEVVTASCVKLVEIERQLEDVDWLVDKFEQVDERMEKLEGEAREHGWKAHD